MRTSIRTAFFIVFALALVAPFPLSHAVSESGGTPTPAIIASTNAGEQLTVFLDHAGDSFRISHDRAWTIIRLYDNTGANYRTFVTNASGMGEFMRGSALAQHLPPSAPTPPNQVSPFSVVSSGWVCYDQFCAQTTADAQAATPYVEHWMDVYRYAKDSDYHLQDCNNGCGDLGVWRHVYGNQGVEHIVCQAYQYNTFHYVWTNAVRDPTWFGGNENPPVTSLTLSSSQLQITGNYPATCNITNNL